MNSKEGQMQNENKKLQLIISDQPETSFNGSQETVLASEIKDIYDSIYGNVQSKLEFYENKRGSKSGSMCSTPTRTMSLDYIPVIENNIQKNSKLTRSSSTVSKNNVEQVNVEALALNPKHEQPQDVTSPRPSTPQKSETSQPSEVPSQTLTLSEPQAQTEIPKQTLTQPIPAVRKLSESPPTLDLLKNCSVQCTKCEKSDFIKDRSEVLTEINANFKLEIDHIRHDLKKEIEKNNELNFEIANIENALEMYYKEAKYQKTTISSIYSSLKNYSKQEEGERYTYKRIKAISDYIETLKVKLQHQDRIIRENFTENPYTTDMMMKYDAILQQLDKLSKENQELKTEIKKKAEEGVEIIKELNRQKFKVEEKCREVEDCYKKELSAKDSLINDIEGKHTNQIGEFELVLAQNTEEMSKMKKVYDARISNYKTELAIVYKKWRHDVCEKKGIEK